MAGKTPLKFFNKFVTNRIKVYTVYSWEEKEKMPYIDKWGILNRYSIQKKKKRKHHKRCIQSNRGNYFLLSLDPFSIYQRHKMKLPCCFLEFPYFPLILHSLRNKTVLKSLSPEKSDPSVAETKIVFLMNNFIFLL